jgi:hypothetical protein
MLLIAFRAINAIFAVVVAILVSNRFGESTSGKLLTVFITSGVVAFFEWSMVWIPKRSIRARRLLDPRSLFAGIWLQDVKRVHGSEGAKVEFPNRFAVFSIAYNKDEDNYRIEGMAYTPGGVEHARWTSTDVVHFSKDGRSMTYEWSGSIMDSETSPDDPRRTGFAHLQLSSDNGGTGRVDHVAVDVILVFNLTRITNEWLAANKLAVEFKTESLYNPEDRDRFAAKFAATQLNDRQARAVSK